MDFLDLQNIKSQRSNEKVYLRFFNHTKRTVEIIWLNFTGDYVSYLALEAGCFVDIDTYKGHPWIVLDYYTRDRLHIDKSFVYFPKTTKEYFKERFPNKVLPPDFQTRIRIYVTIPIYSLRYACLLAIRNCLSNPNEADELELPRELNRDLKKVITQRNNQIIQPLIRIN